MKRTRQTVVDDGAPQGTAPLPDAEPSSANALPIGTRLDEFEIVGLIGGGGFGIVYLVHDHSLGRRVALKEYMPQSLAARGAGATVGVRSTRLADAFEAGRRSFVNEARLLAQFDHPALVKVYRFWEANGTAYMVMPFYQGRTLQDALEAMPAPPDEAWLMRLLAPLLDALEVIHGAQVYHRDIAPDNIMLLDGDRPLLLDFGAARHVISGMTQALTVILKPGYAPIEQYAEVPGLRQGAWTDLYSLAAVVYFAITGKTPDPSVGRMMNDTLPPLAQLAAGRYGAAFLQAIDAALAVKPSARPQDVAEMRARLGLAGRAASALRAAKATPSRWSRVTSRYAAALALGVVAVLAFVGLRGRESAHAPASTGPALPAASTPAVVESPREVSRPFDPRNELDRIFEQRDRGHNVSVTMTRSQVTIGRDRLSFNVSSSRAGYLYVLMVGTDDRHFYLIFPNQIDTDNHVAAGGRLKLPRESWSMIAGGPAGTNQFVAFVSASRRDFTAAGLVRTDPFAEFPFEAAARAVRAASGSSSPFLGTAVCPGAGIDCPAAYGAATFTIEEVDAARR